MLRSDHYDEAERLLAEGVKVVGRIDNVAKQRRQASYAGPAYADYTNEMDELGKKAMGIWAQAQVHALLAQSGAAWHD